MNRYENTSVKFNKKRQRVLKPTLYPKIPLSDEDKFVRPLDGERLDTLAHRHYQDQSLWWVIAKANGLGKGTTILNPDFEIRIPGNITKILDDFTSLNR